MNIYGVTQKQAELLDKMWSIDTMEGIESWKKTLPNRLKLEVDILMILVELSYIDEMVEETNDTSLAESMLDAIKGKSHG